MYIEDSWRPEWTTILVGLGMVFLAADDLLHEHRAWWEQLLLVIVLIGGVDSVVRTALRLLQHRRSRPPASSLPAQPSGEDI